MVNMVIFALIPGVFQGSISERFLMPAVLARIGAGFWELMLGLGLLYARDSIAGFIRVGEDSTTGSAPSLQKLGPVLIQLLALYLVITSSGELLYTLWGAGSADSGLMLKVLLSNMMIEGRFTPVVIMAFALILLFRSHWIFKKLNPEK